VKSGRGRLAVLGRFLPGVLVVLAAVALRQWMGHAGLVLTLTSELLNMGIDAVALLGLSWVLPRRTEKWFELLPGSILGGIGLGALHIAALVYFPSKIERASALYGTLGIALVALLYLFLMGQVFVASAIANAVWVDRRQILDEAGQAP
jgi:membrane protein